MDIADCDTQPCSTSDPTLRCCGGFCLCNF
jgi:hypothetical protein